MFRKFGAANMLNAVCEGVCEVIAVGEVVY